MLTFLALACLLLLAACIQEDVTPVPRPTGADGPTTGAVMSTSTPAPTPTITVTPPPTPIVPAITVQDQALDENGRLTITQVTAPDPGWLAIHTSNDGEPGEVLGQTAVAPGSNNDLTVTIDPFQTTDTLIAMLHIDAGEPDQFEFPGPDEVWQVAGEPVAHPFAVALVFTLPEISVADQDLNEDGIVTVERVVAPTDGWLMIQANEDGKIGPILGHAFVEAGLNQSLSIPIRWRDGTPTLNAVLYEDNGRSRHLDHPGGEDLPVLVNGRPLVTTFDVTYPPDILVHDQPVSNGEVVVDRVISNGAGWLVIYADDEGNLGFIIGSTPLEDGLNKQVVVEVTDSAVTEQLHLMVHEDTTPGDEFDFPGNDQPVLYNGRLPAPFTISTTPGNYLITRDQQLVSDTVTIPLVVVDVDAWVAIYRSAEMTADTLLGRTAVSPGLTHNLEVAVDPLAVESTLYAVLHLDNGVLEEFEFPSGPDVPLRRNRNVIRSPFVLLEEQ